VAPRPGRYFPLRRTPRSETGSLPASIAHHTTAALAALPEDQSNPDGAVERRLTGFLRDLTRAWQVAKPAVRNKIAWQLFVNVIVENRPAVAVKPRPELLPFFQAVTVVYGGSDGIRTRDLSLDRAAC
jgi:hypothetical protein